VRLGDRRDATGHRGAGLGGTVPVRDGAGDRAAVRRVGATRERANARARRLEAAGLLGLERQFVSQARAVFVTGKGFELLGQPRRRAPRPAVQREHEEAIVDLVTRLELAQPDATVLTERDCRRLEHAGTNRFSVEIPALRSTGDRRDRTRWPDAVVEVTGGRRAIEFEFSAKGGRRLKAIVNAYTFSPRYRETLFMVRSAALGRQIAELARSAGAMSGNRTKVRVLAWTGLPAGERAALAEALDGRAVAATPGGAPMSEQVLRSALG
jgi:hypothetical protein